MIGDIWTYVMTTVVAVVVWWWAAGETRVDRTFPVQCTFEVTGTDDWLIEPANVVTTRVTVEGSQRAIQNAEQTVKRLTFALPPRTGSQPVNLVAMVREHPAIAEAGIAVVTTDPQTVSLDVDQFVEVPVRVVPGEVPGVELVGAMTVEPSTVTIRAPRRLLEPGVELTARAIVERADLAGRAPGIQHTLTGVPIELPASLRGIATVTVTPPEGRVSFTIGSRIREVVPPVPVRVQIAGSPEDEARIQVDPELLRDVTVRVTEDLGRRIESGEVKVLALVHLKSSEKEARIERKPVSAFVALLPDGTLTIVDARVGTSTQPPMIGLTILEEVAPE
ncbi:MAG: hypothetical protein HKO59_05780 [Phycisphaerales bacterium]|nr:hypothetical protein [Phycisphaerae bacterium]NNF44740.1 hypothetical protein [Phycisphaerales bacterium]NNM25482.1 hypothetical protein [Phycisphaerales bacterium]